MNKVTVLSSQPLPQLQEASWRNAILIKMLISNARLNVLAWAEHNPGRKEAYLHQITAKIHPDSIHPLQRTANKCQERAEEHGKHTISFVAGTTWSQELDSMILMGTFQPGMFCDPILWPCSCTTSSIQRSVGQEECSCLWSSAQDRLLPGFKETNANSVLSGCAGGSSSIVFWLSIWVGRLGRDPAAFGGDRSWTTVTDRLGENASGKLS